MVDIVHPHCKIEACTTLASFNMPGESRGEFCSQHKLVCDCSQHAMNCHQHSLALVETFLPRDQDVNLPGPYDKAACGSDICRRAW